MICGECGKCGALVSTDAGCGAWIMNYLIFTLLLLLLLPPAKRVSHMKDQWWLWSITLICASDICCLCLTVRRWRLARHGVLKYGDGQIYGHRQGARGWPWSPGKNSHRRKQKNGNILVLWLQPRPLLLKAIDWVCTYEKASYFVACDKNASNLTSLPGTQKLLTTCRHFIPAKQLQSNLVTDVKWRWLLLLGQGPCCIA